MHAPLQSSVTDWIEILTGDNYAENELDGVSELVQAVDIQATGPDEASRAIRKKIKYGSTHKQLRALTLLKSLSENSSTFHKSFISSPQLVDRLKEAAKDTHGDPRVRKKLLLVFLGWKKQDEDGDKGFSRVAGLYGECGGGGHARKPSVATGTGSSSVSSAAPATRDGGLWEDHSWDVSPAAAAASRNASKESEAAAKMDLVQRKAAQAAAQEEKDRKDRERRAIEQRERDLEAREAKLKAKEARKSSTLPVKAKPNSTTPKRPPFNFEKVRTTRLSPVKSFTLTNQHRHLFRSLCRRSP